MEKLISIVMGVYNGEKYLGAQIESILNQTYRNFELLIYDDLSLDDSLSIAHDYALKDARIIVIQNKTNLGIAKNFLQGLSLAKGEYVCFADQDDYWENNKVAVLSELLDKDRENMLSYSDLKVCDEDLNTIDASFWKIAKIRPRSGLLGDKAMLRNIVPGCSMMFRREVFDLLTRVNNKTSFLHDHLALIFASQLGKIIYHKKALIEYRQHGANQIGASHKLVYDKKTFRDMVKKEIPMLKEILHTDLRCIENFVDEAMQRSLIRRLRCLGYYLYIHDDVVKGKILGLLECLSPSLYNSLRHLVTTTDI